jgi:hypothetical protein
MLFAKQIILARIGETAGNPVQAVGTQTQGLHIGRFHSRRFIHIKGFVSGSLGGKFLAKDYFQLGATP